MFAALVLGLTSTASDMPGGWPELFPSLPNFDRKMNAPTPVPKPKKDKEPERYAQSARYEWLGGRFEVLTITLARDPDFKERYAAETVRKLKPAAKELEINKKRAYLWDREKAGEFDKVNRWLVVVLTDDRVLIVEQRAGLDLEEVAKKLDFDKVTKALGSPPPAKK